MSKEAINFRLPNIRRMFVPDPGFTIVDADLSGADAQVVAWEAGDEDLKNAFRKGIKIHVFNARTMFPKETANATDKDIKESPHFATLYKNVKMGCHACNYGATPPALVSNIGWDKSFAESFRSRWFAAHPKIKQWHDRTMRHLQGLECWNCHNQDVTIGRPCPLCGRHLGRTIKNAFGFRRIFFDRIDESILGQALAWNPQSTVAFCTELGWTNLEGGHEMKLLLDVGEQYVGNWKHLLVWPDAHSRWGNVVQFLIQVHDSIVFQIPHAYEDDIPEIVNSMLVKVPYPDELIIPMGFKFSRKSWGDC